MRYTLKVILNGEVKRCWSDSKEYTEDKFNKLKSLSYNDIFKKYGQDAMDGILRIEMYKKNRRAYGDTVVVGFRHRGEVFLIVARHFFGV